MQTFLPYADFTASAAALDRARLGKQRIECWQILRALRGESKGWRNHPAVRMWAGHEGSLCKYALTVCNEWLKRGYRDSMTERFVAAFWDYEVFGPPSWLGDPAFHEAHQSNLIRKDPTFYRERFPEARIGLPYVWPA